MRYFAYILHCFILNILYVQTSYATTIPAPDYWSSMTDTMNFTNMSGHNNSDKEYVLVDDTFFVVTLSFNDDLAENTFYTVLDLGSVRRGLSLHLKDDTARLDITLTDDDGNKHSIIAA